MSKWQRIVAVTLLGFIVLLALMSLDDPTMEPQVDARPTTQGDG